MHKFIGFLQLDIKGHGNFIKAGLDYAAPCEGQSFSILPDREPGAAFIIIFL